MTTRIPLWRRPIAAFVIDVVLVLVFAAVGRRSHAEGVTLTGVLATAGPFLLGTVVGWLVVRLRRRSWPLGVGPGITVWFSTVLFGMLLRALAGHFAIAFVIVAGVTLAVLLIGWRALAARAR